MLKMTTKRVFLETLGCQMNVSDSELMLGMLAQQGFEVVDNVQHADLAIINTCQIRNSAENKAYSHLGYWAKLKRNLPHLKIAMAGCVAQQTKAQVFKRAPYVDFVIGTQNLHDLPQMVERAFAGETHMVAADRQKPRSTYDYLADVAPRRESDISAWVTIIEGCDYFCTYCVVPYTRGRQISRAPESILAEVTKLVAAGFKEITLLGQTVDSYGRDFADRHYRLDTLLHDLSAISGLVRIRFMTSHPLDLSDAIIEAVATLPNVMEYIHIPMQSGDDDILARMKRGYTAEAYYALTDKLHQQVPGVVLSGDYIVGFPGETDEQFERSLASIARSGLYMANTAVYSPRAQTPAALWHQRNQGVIDPAVSDDRLQRLNAAVHAQGMALNTLEVGKTSEVLVEGVSKRNPNRLTGRTRTNKVVNFDSPLPEDDLVGQLVPVHIQQAFPASLMGCYTPPTHTLHAKGPMAVAV
jgi:tRNA-2-methylthio-N6-dimethylallyladenosine synthase